MKISLIIILIAASFLCGRLFRERDKDRLWKDFIIYQKFHELTMKDIQDAMKKMRVYTKDCVFYENNERPSDELLKLYREGKVQYVGDLNAWAAKNRSIK